MANPFCYTELHSRDPKKSLEFYRRLLDWKFAEPQETPVGPYVEIHPGEGNEAGLMTAQGGAPSHWLTYVRVDDLAASVRKARELGAEVMVDSAEVAGTGWFAVLADPTGAHFGLFQKMGK
ncbi:MAG TPA: VOC family protein [Polyangia bacterium]|nr:VOC family protein [Polyangia bacterium]